jgi:HNH endonuclease/NUMOD4 motif-containing protein
MVKDLPQEKWKRISLEPGYTNENIMEVSNYGRIRTFNKMSDGNILKGSMINGYRIIRFKLFKPRDSATINKLGFLQKQVFSLARNIKLMKETREDKNKIKESEALLSTLKKNLSKKFADDTKKRSVYYHALVHRQVAEHFCRKPSDKHTIVAHLDHDRLNNKSSNLKWMTPEDNYEHQRSSPHVIAEKQTRRHDKSRNAKLTVTKVMLLKKLLNQGKPMRTLVKQFKITDTQILRIKRGENWAEIKAAE